jgi:hypothetical protein
MTFGARQIATTTGIQVNGSGIEIMNREILFRGKCVNDEEWVYGYYAMMGIGEMTKHYIIQNGALCGLFDDPVKNMYFNDVEIDVNTLSQYTGYKDYKGNKIFEGDILEFDECYGSIYYDNRWLIHYNENDDSFDECDAYEGLVIGNIYDNPNFEV